MTPDQSIEEQIQVLELLSSFFLRGFDKGARGEQVISSARVDAARLVVMLAQQGYVIAKCDEDGAIQWH